MLSPAWRRSAAALLAAAAAAGLVAAKQDPAGPPPDRLAGGRTWITSKYGMIFEIDYFTEAQIASEAWESRRREMINTVEICRGDQEFTQRDVRWFEPTPESGQRCAAVIYTVRCDTPTKVKEDTLERDRLNLLNGELASPIGKDCGEKDYAKLPNRGSYQLANYDKGRKILIDREVCDFAQDRLDDKILLDPRTRIAVKPVMDSALAARFGDAEVIGRSRFEDRTQRMISGGLTRANKIPNIFPASGEVSTDPVNIEITQAMGLNRAGRSYCVQLTARQAGRTWRRTIERSQLPLPNSEDTKAAKARGTTLTAMDKDLDQLSEELMLAMGLPPAVTK